MMREILVLFLILAGSSDAVVKRWIKYSDYNDADNWGGLNRTPCPTDTINLGAMQPVSVYIQSNLTITELALPMTGEVILGPNVILDFPSNPANVDPSCQGATPGQLAEFQVQTQEWFNLNNWEVYGSLADAQQGDVSKEVGALDIEKIPCSSGGDTTGSYIRDEVLFPENHSYRVNMGTQPLSLQKLNFAGKAYTSTNPFSDFLNTVSGKSQFNPGANRPTVNIGGSCTDVTGCACGNDAMKTVICAAVQCQDRGLQCDNPPTPQGHCCGVCGAVLTIGYGDNFNFQNLESYIRTQYLQQDKYQGVRTILSKSAVSRAGQVQLVLQDDAPGTQNGQTAAAMAQEVRDTLPAAGLGITAVDVQASTKGSGPSGQTGGRMGGGTIAGIVIAVIIVLLIIVLVAFFVRRRSTPLELSLPKMPKMPKMPAFNGKKTLTNEFEMGGATFSNPNFDPNSPDHFSLSYSGVEDLGSSKGFNNPMYDNPVEDNPMYSDTSLSGTMDPASVTTTPPTTPDGDTRDGGIENPIYGVDNLQEVVMDAEC
ncbi:protein amnionless-like [Branchiostoma floridae x Branchiostoma japonicum]